MAGRIRWYSWLVTDAPAPAEAVTGSAFRYTPKMTMTTMPDTNSGTVVAESPATEMTRSAPRPTLSAAMTPPAMPSGTTITNASAASLIELNSADWMNGQTGARYWYDSPKLPCTIPLIHVQYWVTSGRSTPSWWSRACTALGLAKGPRMARAGSPGSTWPAKNTIRLSRNRVISASPSRRTRYIVIAVPSPLPVFRPYR